jgi:Predicted outer membrane protein
MNGFNLLRGCVVAIVFGVASLFALADEDTEFFIDEALMKGWVEIANAKLALQQSSSQEVKGFAQHMIRDHENINAELLTIAQKKEVTLAEGKELQERTKPLMLKVRTGEFFDIAYANNQVIAHQQTIRLFQRAAQSADDDIRNFVQRQLPTMEQHLRMAEQLVAATAETRTDIYQDRDGKNYDSHQHMKDIGDDTDQTDNL